MQPGSIVRVMLIVALCLSAQRLAADEVGEIKATLASQGLKPVLTTLVLEGENAVVDQLAAISAPQRALLLATRQLKQLDDQAAEGKRLITVLRQEHVRLSAELANVNGDVELNNKLVALNALSGQMELTQGQLEQHDGKVREARGKANEARKNTSMRCSPSARRPTASWQNTMPGRRRGSDAGAGADERGHGQDIHAWSVDPLYVSREEAQGL